MACSEDGNDSPETELRRLVLERGLTGDPALGRDLPDIRDPKAQLGMKLFYTKALGGDLDSACVTCHHPVLGGGDNLSLPVGVGAVEPDLLGPGRLHDPAAHGYDGGPTVPRNAPTTFNVALWDQVMFHDGRVESLGKTQRSNGDDGQGIRTPDVAFGVADPQSGDNVPTAQARFPVTSVEEMRGVDFATDETNDQLRERLQERVGNYGRGAGELDTNQWLAEFRIGFGAPGGTAEELITFENIVDAIGEYERSQVFVDTPWRAWVQGDENAIDESAKRGALLFFRSTAEGGANCASCHTGDFFTDEGFHVLAMPQVGRGKGDGVSGDDDFGRMRETGDAGDKYAFRTPSLLNVEATGPWGHAGAYTTLEAVVRHTLHPSRASAGYDFSQLDAGVQIANAVVNTQAALTQLQANRAAGVPSIENVELTDAEVDDLLAFLRSLTDPCVLDRACMAPWIPDETVSDPDQLRLDARDRFGTLL